MGTSKATRRQSALGLIALDTIYVCVCVCVYFLLGGAGPIVVPTPLETYVANRYVPHSALRPCPD